MKSSHFTNFISNVIRKLHLTYNNFNISDIEDAVDESFSISLIKQIEFISKEHFINWHFKTSKNILFKSWNKQKAIITYDLWNEEFLDYIDSILFLNDDISSDSEDILDKFYKVIDILDIESLELIDWIYNQEYSTKQIAEFKCVKEVTIRKRHQRAMEKFRKIWEELPPPRKNRTKHNKLIFINFEKSMSHFDSLWILFMYNMYKFKKIILC